jgi:hypothetical protein
LAWLVIPSPLRGEGWERVLSRWLNSIEVLEVIRKYCFDHPPLHPLPSRDGKRPQESRLHLFFPGNGFILELIKL